MQCLTSCNVSVPGQLQDYRTQRWVPIHYPPGGLDDSLRRSALGDIPGLRLPKRVIVSKGTASVGGSLKNAAARLTLCLNNKVRLTHPMDCYRCTVPPGVRPATSRSS